MRVERNVSSFPLARLVLALAAAVSSVVTSAPASAAGTELPSLAVVVVPVEEGVGPAAARLSQLAEQTARSVGRHQVRDLAGLLDPEGAKARTAKAEEAQRAYEQARRFYDELEVVKSAEQCDKSLAALEKSDLTTNFPLLVRSWMFRIAALIANADMKSAMIELSLLLPVDLKTPFDSTIFQPDFLATVKSRRDELRAKSTFPLVVGTRPVSAKVYVNGVFRGVTPLEVKGLPPADHYLTLVAPGYQQVQKRVRPGGEKLVETLEPTLKGKDCALMLEKIARDYRSGARTDAARAVARELGVDQVLVIAANPDNKELGVVGFRVSEDGVELARAERALPAVEERWEADAEAFLTDLLSMDRPGASPAYGSWTGRHTGYVLLGGATAALVSGLVFGSQALAMQNEFDANPNAQLNRSHKRQEEAGRSYALIADLSFIGSAVLGGAGAYLSFIRPARVGVAASPAAAAETEAPAYEQAAAPEAAAPEPVPEAAPEVEKKPVKPAGKPKKSKSRADDLDDWRDDG